MLIGYLEREAKETRRLRKLCWTIVCGYADKSLPSNEMVWWPVAGDPKIIGMTKRRLTKMLTKFRSTQWTLNSVLKSEQK